MSEPNKEDLKKIINEFEDNHIVKQIILIGFDGAVKNIEFTAKEWGEDEGY